MKTAGYWSCRNEIINAHLSTPHKYEPFTELFDTEKLDEIRSKYGSQVFTASGEETGYTCIGATA